MENFSHKAVKIIDDAKDIAENMHSQIVGSEHLLIALYDAPDGICSFLLNERLITKDDLLKEINDLIILRKKGQETIYTKELTDIVKGASALVKEIGGEYVFDEHLFYALLTVNDNIGKNILTKLGIDIDEILEDIEDIFNFNAEKKKHPFPFLTNLSIVETTHEYINLGNYIEKLQIIMNKKQKNNPMLVGNAGVGKTAIVEGFAKKIDQDIYRLDLGSMLSGTKYRGELEEKIINAMEYIKEHDAILFIDEIHNIVGAGSNEGTLDIANILKPYLARSQIRCIGATTLDEYYRFMEKDKALMRRFQNIFVEEPSLEETFFLLQKIKQSYETYHDILYDDELLVDIVKKAKRYLVNRTFPDKAIDVLDELGARYQLQKTNNLFDLTSKVVFDMCGIDVISVYELAKITLNYEQFRFAYERYLTDLDYNQCLVMEKINEDWDINLFKADLEKVFHFKEEEYLEIDLANYSEVSMLNNLIGSAKGYVGYESGGLLAEHLIRYPLSLVYFKNFDSAHVLIQNFIKKLFTDVYFIDNKSRKIYLNNVIILYSGENVVSAKIGF